MNSPGKNRMSSDYLGATFKTGSLQELSISPSFVLLPFSPIYLVFSLVIILLVAHNEASNLFSLKLNGFFHNIHFTYKIHDKKI